MPVAVYRQVNNLDDSRENTSEELEFYKIESERGNDYICIM